MKKITLVASLVVAACIAVVAQQSEPLKADLTIRADQPKGTINRNLYGQFAEHLGGLIYGGIWVGEDSPIPNSGGYRNDVLAALKNLSIPVLRWPGGCFADEYHWRDGIGPRAQRPRHINTNWGGVVETNAFGTHEFLDLCERIGAAPYISGNVGTGTPQEMMDWVEYMTSDSDSTLANLRRQNGRDKAWKVPYFGVGNESWGCGGNMRPEFYADQYRRYATYVKSGPGNRVTKIASGASDFNYKWTEVLMSEVGRRMDGLSLHYYTLPTGLWEKKGSATEFGEAEWHATMAQTLKMEELIRKHSAIMDKYDPQKQIGLMVDEWGTWYDVEPGTNPGFLYQQSSMRDAVVAGINLNIFQEHSDRVQMANIAQVINVLQAMILTDKEKMLLTPTYHVFEMYKVHQGATLIPTEMKAPSYGSVPALHASASRDAAGKLHLSLVNLDPNRAGQVLVKVTGAAAKSVTGSVLTAPQMNTINTFDKHAVRPAPYTTFTIHDDRIDLSVPSKSVLVLEIQ
ncbi:MAG: alpha-N-arabinofuranosidase [Bryobacteraceae bacterium]